MKHRIFTRAVGAAFLCVFFLSISDTVFAAPRKITIKLAASVPENTPWGAHLNQMAGEWARATNGEVELKIFYNGVLGDEAKVMKMLRQNSIQAAILTSFGLNELTPQVLTLSGPFLIRDEGELDAVMRVLKPEL
jgi:TRAP-type C4-dicarboxylate transport system substrate-binding protein